MRSWFLRSRAFVAESSGLKAAAMESLNHLKTDYRPRFFRDGQRKADVHQENILEYIQDCFDNCANAFTACSPSKSRCSSSSLNQDQDEVPPHSNKKKQTDPEADKINYLKNVFNIFTSLPSPDRKDRGSGDNLSENAEASNESYVYPLDETVDALPLGSVALLLEEEEESHGGMLHFDEEAVVTSLQNIRGIEESEGRKETQEWLIDQPKSLATSSTQKKHLESLVSLEAVKRSMQRNVIDVEPEDECEFVIEESFGVPSTFWISASQKKEKPQKNILTEASSRGEKRIKHDSVKKVGQASKKLVAGTPVKQSKTKVAKVAERTSDRLKNASRNKEILTMVEYQSKLAVSANKEVRKQMDSKEKASGINNESCGDSASRNQSEDLASLLEEGDDFSVQPQPLRNTAQAQEPSQSEQCMRQKCSKVTPLAEIRKEAFQYFTNRDVYSEELIEDHHFSKVALPVQSIAEQLPCSKKSVKQICSKMKPSVEKLNKDRQECGIISLSSEVCLNSRDANKHSEDQLSVLKPITIIGPAAQQSSHTKSVRKQKPSDISLPEKQIKTRSNNVKRSVRGTRKKSKVLVLEESSESRHEEDQCDAGGKSFHKIRTNKAQKTPSALVSLEENDYGNISDEQNPCEQCAAEIRLNASKDQQSSNMHPLQCSYAPDANMNNISGPVCSKKRSSRHAMMFNKEDSTSDESEDLDKNLDASFLNLLKHKLVLPTNTPNVRRTKRRRVKPLEYWRGERVQYKPSHSGGFVVGGILSPVQNRSHKIRKAIKPVVDFGNISDHSISLKDPSQPAVIFDSTSQQEVLLECVSSGSSHAVFISNEKVSIYKYLSTPTFSAGKMIIKPLEEKGFQYSYTDTMIIDCDWKLKDTCILLLKSEMHFQKISALYMIIKWNRKGNVYNIRNLLNKECVILFTQLKGNRSEET